MISSTTELHALNYNYIYVAEICALLGYYTACSGNSVPTFRYNISVPSSRVKNSKKNAFMLVLSFYAI